MEDLDIGDSKRKRRSRADNEGRDHKCSECGRRYLSASALYNHRKIKHDPIVNQDTPKQISLESNSFII